MNGGCKAPFFQLQRRENEFVGVGVLDDPNGSENKFVGVGVLDDPNGSENEFVGAAICRPQQEGRENDLKGAVL